MTMRWTGSRTRRVAATGLAGIVAAATLSWPMSAHAAPPGPNENYAQRTACIDSLARPATVANGVSWGQRALQYTSAWQFSRGAGQTVAVIDTGVNPGPAFGNRLSAGADLVQATKTARGLSDCDGHGTLVAGLIAASPDPKSGFTGVAPDARIVSIRQSSANFAVGGANGGGTSADAPGAGTVGSLAEAVRYAARDVHARVINISLANCQAAGNADSSALTAAVRSAVLDYDAVVVSAAGNLDGNSGPCSKQNTPGKAPVTAAAPADVELPGVLAVGSIGADGAPSAFSLAGSWVDLAAPGTQVIATNPYPGAGGQVNKITTQQGAGSIQGTSFAAPYVSGVVALVRAHYPQLRAAEVTALLERTASHPAAPGGRDDYVGYGLVDPVAALSDPQVASASAAGAVRALPVRTTRAASTRPERVALFGGLTVAAVLVLFLVGTQTLRARRKRAA